MARVKIGLNDTPRKTDGKLIDRLAEELRLNRISGQPFIYEQTFTTGKIRMLVVWDAWKDLPLEERTSIILAAVEQSEGKAYRANVALASGVTVPEAVAAGMLPYQIITARRKSDPVSAEQCREAMLEEGASEMIGNTLQLRFPTEESAAACKARLVQRLQGSEDIWIITRELTPFDFGQFESTGAQEQV